MFYTLVLIGLLKYLSNYLSRHSLKELFVSSMCDPIWNTEMLLTIFGIKYYEFSGNTILPNLMES